MTKCPKCKGAGWIIQSNGKYRKCECITQKENIEALVAAGLNLEDINKSFKTFTHWNKAAVAMKDLVTSYYLQFETLKKSRHNSLALLGQSGSGKTHLLIALINNLIKYNNLNIKYVSYIDTITMLKQNIINGPIYQEKICKFKQCDVLAIDDLFKGGYKASDIRIMMELINYRYINNKIILISSELSLQQILELDNALGGRIKEMTKGHVFYMQGKDKDYRCK